MAVSSRRGGVEGWRSVVGEEGWREVVGEVSSWGEGGRSVVGGEVWGGQWLGRHRQPMTRTS